MIQQNKILKLLRSIDPFPARKGQRKAVMQPGQDSVQGFALGTVHKFDEGLVKSKFNSRYPELLREARKLMHGHDPSFRYTSIQVNKNQKCAPHRDANNKGPSYIIGFGNYTGGEVVVVDDKDGQKKKFSIKNTFVKFDGRNLHYTEPFKGERYSLVFFSLKKPHVLHPRIQTKKKHLRISIPAAKNRT